MIVCSCNRITDVELRTAIREMLVEEPWQLIVPNKLFHYLQERGKCGFCFSNVIEVILSTTEEFHAQLQGSVEQYDALKRKMTEMTKKHERWLLLVRQSRANQG
jgi:bacterioferritin-associated ferredoxin